MLSSWSPGLWALGQDCGSLRSPNLCLLIDVRSHTAERFGYTEERQGWKGMLFSLAHGRVLAWTGPLLQVLDSSLGYMHARPSREANFPRRPAQHGVSREPTMRASAACVYSLAQGLHTQLVSQPANALPPGQTQAVLKALKVLRMSGATEPCSASEACCIKAQTVGPFE